MNYIENIKKDGLYLRHIYKKEQTKEMCLAALNQNIESYEFIAVRLLDKDILSFIISNGINQDKSNQKKLKKLYNAIIDLGRKARKTEDLYYLNEEFFIKAVELDYRMLLFIPDEKQTYQMCFDLVKENPNALLYINTDYMTEELCIEVIKKDGNAIEFIPSDKLNENICLNALEQNWEAIEYISKEHQTEKVCMKAIDKCYISIRYIDEEILNKLDLTKYCFCMERKDISRINDERIKKLKISTSDVRFYFGFIIVMDKLLESNVSTNFLIDNTIEFDRYKKLALSKNTIILLDNANTEEKYRLLANYVLKTN